MKKAFTLLEVVFVIVVVGILSIVIIPKFGANNLNEAATQVVSYIRYTQHLAMSNDKYDSSDVDIANYNSWFEKRWRIKFSKSAKSDGRWSYTIFDDRHLTAAGQPNPDEIAVNPVDRNKRLTGGCAGMESTDPRATGEMHIGNKYGIDDIDFSSSCGGQTITFDHLGRPIRGATNEMLSAYNSDTTANNILISERCQIDLCTVSNCTSADSDEKISIIIEPETGYTCVLNSDGNCTGV